MLEALTAGREPAELADHGQACCALARTWLERLDASFHRCRAASAPPAWVAHRWTSGATIRPLHWCEIPGSASLDRGGSAALCRALWAQRSPGIRAVQLVEHRVCAPTWRARDGVDQPSAGGRLAYREAVGRGRDGALEIWDSTDCAWLPATPRGGSGRTLSLRVRGGDSGPLRWAGQRVDSGSWTMIESIDALPPGLPKNPQPPNAACAAAAPAPARSQKA